MSALELFDRERVDLAEKEQKLVGLFHLR